MVTVEQSTGLSVSVIQAAPLDKLTSPEAKAAAARQYRAEVARAWSEIRLLNDSKTAQAILSRI
ncbi:hypothetical protein A2160_02100 [Candidatus Beckwithbacteria bacterium RBG_13_42_9]|uniref:Uncharacterized protein n=1 Tax=Candidatus Beckwithbacteria bacterium RBG_13_42_9 TaxID=1797457 RepID=A0A1F5E7J4_9BACT|nr:MAG: hypothetical protein A2160_02100 [Candidatus Beckwithbacteria bacterium RBG_13_42_9]